MRLEEEFLREQLGAETYGGYARRVPMLAPPHGEGDPCKSGSCTTIPISSWLGVQIHYRGNIVPMALAHSKVTAQGQVSVPAKVRQRLGVGPGSVLEWDEDGDRVVVRKAGRYSSEDIHRVLFSKTPRRRTVEEMKNGIRRYIKKRHAGR